MNQDVDLDVLSEFQSSPVFNGMATSRLNPASSCVTGYHLVAIHITRGLKAR